MLGRRLKDNGAVPDRFDRQMSLTFNPRYKKYAPGDELYYNQNKKHYNRVTDVLYYSHADAIEARLRSAPYIVNPKLAPLLESIGFRETDYKLKSSDSVTYKLRRDIPFDGCNLIGVDYNSKQAAINAGVKFDAYDLFRPNNLLDPLSNFCEYCYSRWKFQPTDNFIQVIEKMVNWYRKGFRNKLKTVSFEYEPEEKEVRYEQGKKLSEDDLRVTHLFEKSTSGFTHYEFNERSAIMKCFGERIVNPSPGPPYISGEKKNKTIINGFVHNYDYIFGIGESPGKYYLKYISYINKQNCFIFDPRDIAFSNHATHYKRLFTTDDVVTLRNKALSQSEKRFLVRIDIRSDKPPNYKAGDVDEAWERAVQRDNELIVTLINSMPDNVTVLAKMRPVYLDDSKMPVLKKEVLLLPEPYLTPSTAEFIIFLPAKFLKYNSSDLLQGEFITYKLIEDYSNYVCALKRGFGEIYNVYLSDNYLWLNVIKENVFDNDSNLPKLTNAVGLYSLSNFSEYDPDYLKKVRDNFSNAIITFKYGSIESKEKTIVTKGRVYKDYAIDMYDEVTVFKDLIIAPTYHFAPGQFISYEDLTTVLITDREGMVRYNQPIEIMSTQVVKIVTYILREIFINQGTNWSTVNHDVRLSVLRKYQAKLEMANFSGKVSIDDVSLYLKIRENSITVSGHLLYIILGSFLGVPYGINKYIREIRNNVINGTNIEENGMDIDGLVSYEGSRGTSIWHCYLSHMMAIDCVYLIVSYWCNIASTTHDKLTKVLAYIRIKLTEIADEYPVYRLHDEWRKF